VDAKDLLRRYLEQRRELGEREFVLDTLSVDDALRALGAPVTPTMPPDASQRAVSDDWRETLRAAGAEPPTARAGSPTSKATPSPTVVRAFGPSAPTSRTPDADPRPADAAPRAPDAEAAGNQGIVIGSAMNELFGGPLADAATLEEIALRVAVCTACALHETARNPVPGEGNARAQFVCVGEAPGATEDEQGRPFVGQAGQLLTKILEAVNLRREDVFICNVLKHRPPSNRNPAPDEIAACKPYLLRQLELLRPRVILALGTFAAQTLLETKLPIGRLRGQVHTFHGIPLVVTYHPAALLRNPAWKRPTWEDVQFARRILDRVSDTGA
jgi:uracil-DNA glycosylase family 4